jgi:FlaA1/EpsC-like NDP-sugar epimerase
MLKKLIRNYQKYLLIASDLLLLNAAFILSFLLRFDLAWTDYIEVYYLGIISVIGITVLFVLNIYNKMWRYTSVHELKIIIQASFLINLIFAGVVFFGDLSFSRAIIIINFFLVVSFLGGIRFAVRILNRSQVDFFKSNDSQEKILIVGAGDAAETIIREIDKYPIGKEIIGLVDDAPHKQGLAIHNKKVLGTRHDIPAIIDNYNLDGVIIAIPSVRGQAIKEIYNLSNRDGVQVSILPALDEILTDNITLSQIREVRVEDLLGREQVELDTADLSSYFAGKTVLVTGGGGSIGSEICRQISHFNPDKLIILDIYENNTYFLELELENKFPQLDIVPIIASVRDRDKLQHVFKNYQPDVVFHAAAHKHVPLMEANPGEAVKNNVLGTKKVAETAAQFAVDRFVLISSDKAVNPTNVMGATKRSAEMIIQAINRESKTKFMGVRFGNVLGSHGSVIPLFKKQIKRGGPITVTDEEIERYFMTIPEAAQLVIEAGTLGQGGEVFILDMEDPVKIIELAQDLIELSGLEVGTDIEIEITGLRPGEKMYEELLTAREDKLATKHQRIFIAQLEEIDVSAVEEQLAMLEEVVEQEQPQAIVDCLIDLVESYQPKSV